MKKTLLVAFMLAAFGGRAAFGDAPETLNEAKSDADAGQYSGLEKCVECHLLKRLVKRETHFKAFQGSGIAADRVCETCHGPGARHSKEQEGHEIDDSTIKNLSKVEKGKVTAICLKCHRGESRMNWETSPHAADNISCLDCHAHHSNKKERGQLKTKTISELCYRCHADIKALAHNSVHMPIDDETISCASCHNPHGSRKEDNVLTGGKTNGLCYKCHADKRGPFLWDHPPVSDDCLNCHYPMGSHNANLLKVKPPFLCQRCHISSRHPAVLYDAADAASGHNRVFNKACVNCHSNIHGSNHPSGKFFLR